jgi:hypothetical protein
MVKCDKPWQPHERLLLPCAGEAKAGLEHACCVAGVRGPGWEKLVLLADHHARMHRLWGCGQTPNCSQKTQVNYNPGTCKQGQVKKPGKRVLF